MGNTHWRSDLREYGAARTASFSTFQGSLTGVSGTFSSTLTVTGLTTVNGGIYMPSSTYMKLGDIYIVTAAAASVDGFTNASINALASTALTGIVASKGDIPRGSIFINASSNAVASNIILVKVGLASWAGINDGGTIPD